MAERPTSPTEAKGLGLRWYFTGKPCPQGHIAKRSVSNSECRACVEAKHRKRYHADLVTGRAKEKERYWRNHEAKLQQMRASRERHKEKRRQEALSRYHNDPNVQLRTKQRATAWAKQNPGKVNSFTAARRARIIRATPTWLTHEQRQAIQNVYEDAAARNGAWHVDHIIPLNGRGVCGLHVPTNLQILPALENVKKGNSFG